MRPVAGAWLLTALLLAGCGAGRGGSGAAEPRPAWEAPGTRVLAIQTEPVPIEEQMRGQPGILLVEVSEQGFVPPLIRVREGSRVRIHLRNTGAREHNMVIPRFGIVAGAIPPGGQNYIEFTASEKGRWPFFSDAPGQAEIGLAGTLVVE